MIACHRNQGQYRYIVCVCDDFQWIQLHRSLDYIFRATDTDHFESWPCINVNWLWKIVIAIRKSSEIRSDISSHNSVTTHFDRIYWRVLTNFQFEPLEQWTRRIHTAQVQFSWLPTVVLDEPIVVLSFLLCHVRFRLLEVCAGYQCMNHRLKCVIDWLFWKIIHSTNGYINKASYRINDIHHVARIGIAGCRIIVFRTLEGFGYTK